MYQLVVHVITFVVVYSVGILLCMMLLEEIDMMFANYYYKMELMWIIRTK